MTTLHITFEDEQEERVLIAFLNSLKYNYTTEDANDISDAQKEEILKREADFESGKITSEPWADVRKRFLRS